MSPLWLILIIPGVVGPCVLAFCGLIMWYFRDGLCR